MNTQRQQNNEAGEYLIDVAPDSSNHPVYVLVRCPVCGTEIIDDLEEHKYSHGDPVADHVATHSPADLDLDGTHRFTPMADILTRLHGLDAD